MIEHIVALVASWLLEATHVRTEAFATARSVGYAIAEARYTCGQTLEAACVEIGLTRTDEIVYGEALCSGDDGQLTCIVSCSVDCSQAYTEDE